METGIKYAEINDLKAFLNKTDYHLNKHREDVLRGVADPYTPSPELLNERQSARDRINALEDEILVLEEELKNHVETIDELEL